jgi:hypothetical protein
MDSIKRALRPNDARRKFREAGSMAFFVICAFIAL